MVSVVKINVLEVPAERGAVLEERFAARGRGLTDVDGFEGFQLLRPTAGTDRYLVVTWWRDEAAFEAWTASEHFGASHGGRSPAASGSELWSFEVATGTGHAEPDASTPDGG